ncbi:MAG: hypothetical protein FWB78_10690 [Treponema sp.]|nr:hypothetical protein [Treponema sp.]
MANEFEEHLMGFEWKRKTRAGKIVPGSFGGTYDIVDSFSGQQWGTIKPGSFGGTYDIVDSFNGQRWGTIKPGSSGGTFEVRDYNDSLKSTIRVGGGDNTVDVWWPVSSNDDSDSVSRSSSGEKKSGPLGCLFAIIGFVGMSLGGKIGLIVGAVIAIAAGIFGDIDFFNAIIFGIIIFFVCGIAGAIVGQIVRLIRWMVRKIRNK